RRGRDRPRRRHHRHRRALQPRRLRAPRRGSARSARGDLPGARRLRRRRRWRRRRRRCARDDRPRGLRDRRGGGAVSITEIPRPTSARPEATGPASTTDPSATAPADGPRTLWDRPGVRAAAGALLPLLILAAWQLVTSTGLVPAYRLPGPLTVL